MADTIGAVQIVISGDTTKFQADLAKAAGIAQTAGAKIASSLTSGMAPAVQGASLLVDQFGRAIQSEATTAAAAVPKVEALAAATRSLGAAHGAAVTQIQATSGAIRVLEGSGGLRAAERFLTMIPGVGAALTGIFPLVGLIAVGEIISRLVEKFGKLSEEEKKAKEEADATAKSIASIGKEIQALDNKAFVSIAGTTAGKAVEAAHAQNDAAQARRYAALVELDVQRQAAAIQKDLATGVTIEQAGSAASHYSGSLKAKIAVYEEARHKLNELQLAAERDEKKAADLSRQTIQGSLDDERKGENEAIDAANAAAAAKKKQAEDIKNAAETMFADLQADHQLTKAEEIEFWTSRLAEVSQKSSNYVDIQRDYLRKLGALAQEKDREDQIELDKRQEWADRIAEIDRRNAEDRISQASHWLDEEIKQKRDRDKLQTPTREQNDQISNRLVAGSNGALELAEGLKRAHIETVNAISSQIEQDQKLLALAQAQHAPLAIQLELQKKITAEKLQQAEQGARTPAQLLGAKLDAVAGGGASLIDTGTTAAANLVQSAIDGISNSLAKAILEGKHFGQIFGQLGRQLAQQALGSVIKMGLDGALHSLIALIPAFGQVAGAQAAAAATAKASTSMTDIGEAQGNAAVAATGAAAAVAWIPIVGPALAAAAAAEMYGSLSPYIALAAFADGGRPPVGVPSIVGERGPELFIPDSAGTIVPNGQFGGGGGYPLSSSSSSSSVSIGAVHVHGVTDGRQFAEMVFRELPNVAKARSARFSAAGGR